MNMTDQTATRLVVCISNEGYPASLETRKLYQELRGPEAGKRELLRVVDESGEDYLFPSTMFVPLELSGEATEAILRVS
jgi:hypothetical protein